PELVGQWPYGPVMAVAMEGNMVYYGNGAAVIILDISTPSTPQILSEIAMPDAVQDLALSGNYLYVAADSAGLRIVDVSDPVNPVETGHADVPDGALHVAVSGSFAYAAQWGDFRCIDVSNPQSPQEVSFWEYMGLVISDIEAMNSFVYLTEWAGHDGYQGLIVIDLSDPLNPREIGRGRTEYGTESVTVFGDYAYVTNSWGPMTTPWLKIFDISNPADPQFIDQVGVGDTAWDTAVSGNYLYLIDYALRVFDISVPTVPIELGSWPVPAEARAIAVSGSYSGVAAWQEGLRIADVSDPSAPFEISFINSPGDARDVVMEGNLAHVAGSYGLNIIDWSDVSSPVRMGRFETTHSVEAVGASGNFAYVISGDWRTGDLWIVDVSDPTSPAGTGSAGTPDSPIDMDVSGDFSYIIHRESPYDVIAVFDISDPTNPFMAGTEDIPEGFVYKIAVSGSHAYVAVTGSYAFVSEYDISLVSRTSMKTINIADPSSPVGVSSIFSPRVESMTVTGNHLFAALGDAGVNIYDLSGCCTGAPVSFNLLSPEDRALSQRDEVRLRWENSSEALYFDVYLDTVSPPLAQVAVDLPGPALTVSVLPATTYYWQIVAKNACGTTASAIFSFTTYTDNIYRFDSRASFAAHTPTDTFPASNLPWIDPDNVLDSSAPVLLYYDASFSFGAVAVVKDAMTIRIESK
ncbi:LVIVD repeat-containing protein, partial [Acidobacteriota bacterium]